MFQSTLSYDSLTDPATALAPAGGPFSPPVPGTIRRANEIPMNMVGPAAPSAGGTAGFTQAQVKTDNAIGAADIARREGGGFAPGGFAPALARTFQEEGGFAARDANGAAVNFGINQAAHPEVDVSKLTKEQAAAIYKRDYWDKIGGDALAQQNPALAHVAFDMAVVAGPGKALEFIKQSGGDADKFMDLRSLYLEGLIRSDPQKYGRFAPAWRNRNADLRADIGAAKSDPGSTRGVQVAEGPATTMTDASSAPAAPADANRIEIPPAARAALGLPPLERSVESSAQIISPGALKALGMTPGGYETDASGNLKVSPSPPVAPQGVDRTISKLLTAFGVAPAMAIANSDQTSKGALAGAERDITGPLSMLPGSVGQWAQEETNELNKTGNAFGRDVGSMIPLTIPLGEAFSAARLGEKAWKAGESLLPATGRGAASGAGVGLVAGTGQSAEAPDWAGRLREKAPGIAEDMAGGAALGGLTPGALGAVGLAGRELGGLYKTVTGAYGREAEKAAEDLRSGVSGELGGATSARDKARRIAILEGRRAERSLALQEAELAGAEQQAQKITQEFAARLATTPEELGQRIHDAAVEDVAQIKARREQESGFAAAVKSDGGEPSVPTKQFMARIAEAEKRAVNPEMKSALAWARTELKTPGSGAKPGITAVSTERARRIIQGLDSRIDGLEGSEKHELLALKKDFVEHLETVRPDLKEAKRRYAELSRDLDPYERTGAARKIALEDPYSGDAVVDSTKIVGALLNGTEGGADVVARLVAKNPELMDSARGYFNFKLQEAAGGKGLPTPAQFDAFMRRNRIALKRVGMADVKTAEEAKQAFRPAPETKPATEAPGAVTVEYGGKTYSGATKLQAVEAARRETGHSLDAIWDAATDNATRVAPQAAAPIAAPLKTAPVKPSEPPLFKEFSGLEREVDQSQKALESTTAARDETQKSITQLAGERIKADKARTALVEFKSALDTVAPREAPAAASAAIEKLHTERYLTDAQLDEFNRQIREVKDKYKDADKAAHFLRYVLLPAAAAAAGAAGIGGVAEYFSHRIRP